MIGYLSGNIKFLADEYCILEVQGVGYKIFVDSHTRETLKLNETVEFFIHTSVREDAITLFGFKNRSSFELFEMLLMVSGIGSKGALNIVSKISAEDFSKSVINHDLKTLMSLPGIGKKSAERIFFELENKIKNLLNNKNMNPKELHVKLKTFEEATEALLSLGYTQTEIASVIKRSSEDFTTEELIKFALKELNNISMGR